MYENTEAILGICLHQVGTDPSKYNTQWSLLAANSVKPRRDSVGKISELLQKC